MMSGKATRSERHVLMTMSTITKTTTTMVRLLRMLRQRSILAAEVADEWTWSGRPQVAADNEGLAARLLEPARSRKTTSHRQLQCLAVLVGRVGRRASAPKQVLSRPLLRGAKACRTKWLR